MRTEAWSGNPYQISIVRLSCISTFFTSRWRRCFFFRLGPSAITSGKLHVLMSDGKEFDAVPGDVTALPQGHDAWVVGKEPVDLVDWWGASNYAR